MDPKSTSSTAGALGGPLAARVIADVAMLVGEIAGASDGTWDEAGATTAQAVAIQRRAYELSGVDVEAHAEAVDLLRRRTELDPERRDWEIGRALAGAAKPPLEIVQVATDAAVLAAEVAERCPPELSADAVTACLLAEASGRAAAHLLEINLGITSGDERLATAQASLSSMKGAAERALAGA